MKFSLIVVIGILLILAGCNKVTNGSDEKTWNDVVSGERGDITLEDEFEKVIVEPLVQPEDCDYIASGIIHFVMSGEVAAVLDFGDGTCDQWATVTKDGEAFDIDLLKEDDKDWKKVVIEPLIELEGCDYIVAGIIKLYKEDEWICTIDFGDGTCDEWVTKTWDGGSEEFSMANWK